MICYWHKDIIYKNNFHTKITDLKQKVISKTTWDFLYTHIVLHFNIISQLFLFRKFKITEVDSAK